MSLQSLLEERREEVLEDWMTRITAVYAKGLKRLIKARGDRFTNPVQGALREASSALYDAVVQGADREELVLILDTPLRLRAVQGLKPSEAVGFLFELKTSIRHVLARQIRKQGLEAELPEMERRIDAASLVAFDGYVGCREHLLQLRTRDERRTTLSYLRRAGLAVQTDVSSSEGCGKRGANG